jgi:hypothetical protein
MTRIGLEWQQHGLQEPKKVTEATEAYRDETDILAQFCRECCMLLGSAKTQSSTLLKAFEKFTGLMVSPVEFADIMKASGRLPDSRRRPSTARFTGLVSV